MHTTEHDHSRLSCCPCCNANWANGPTHSSANAKNSAFNPQPTKVPLLKPCHILRPTAESPAPDPTVPKLLDQLSNRQKHVLYKPLAPKPTTPKPSNSQTLSPKLPKPSNPLIPTPCDSEGIAWTRQCALPGFGGRCSHGLVYLHGHRPGGPRAYL